MADIALLASEAADAPRGYQVPGAQEIVLKSITASFDGSGAGGDFIPTLLILAPNGAVLAACPVSTQVAAGASADVSWFPRGGVATSGGSGITEIDSGDGSITVTNPTGPITDLSVNFPTAGGSYLFVSELTANGSVNNLTFVGIPQDARHLVLYLHYAFSNSVPVLTFNGDTAANYRTLSETVQDLNGAVTSANASLTAQSGVGLTGMDGETCRAVVTIPYYRDHVPPGAGGIWFGRSFEVESWTETEDVVFSVSLVRHVKQTGYWTPGSGPPPDPAITSLNIFVSGGVCRASLYKVV